MTRVAEQDSGARPAGGLGGWAAASLKPGARDGERPALWQLLGETPPGRALCLPW